MKSCRTYYEVKSRKSRDVMLAVVNLVLECISKCLVTHNDMHDIWSK